MIKVSGNVGFVKRKNKSNRKGVLLPWKEPEIAVYTL